jgi:hypothetical protein
MALDIDSFLTAPVGPMETKFDTLPGGEYTAMIGSPEEGQIKNWMRTGTREDGSLWITLNVPFEIVGEEALKQSIGLQKLTTRATIWLDSENGKLAVGKGKNITLGQLREAAGQNHIENWDPSMLIGAGPMRIVTNVTKGKDGREYSNVLRFAKV